VKRLIEKGLMFGNLVPVTSPVLVDRYNRALRHLTGRETTLTDFHIDIAGQSPEIADELGDPLYLNPHGVNRQFILLTTEQKTAPLLEATFSTSRGILRQFIDGNEAQLFALTARDAVAGELVNSVFRLDSAARLFDIGTIRVEADTTGGAVATAARLDALIDRFRTEDDAWWDDLLIAQMIELAEETGDITRNPLKLNEMSFEQDNFWTAHFGGLYVFRGVPHPAAITMGDKASLGPLPIAYCFERGERSRIARFLMLNDLVEPIVEARGIDSAAILRQKMDFIVAEIASVMGEELEGATRRDLRLLGRRFATLLPADWQGLADLVRWAEEGGDWPRIDSEHPAYFYTLRARDVPDADLVNMLLAELSPLDIRQLFICHKEAFYRAYAAWPETKQAYVADFLHREYMVDKSGARAALFGHEQGMDNRTPPAGNSPWVRSGGPSQTPRDDLVELVGPWGAVTRERNR